MNYCHALLAVAALSATTLAQTPQPPPPAFRVDDRAGGSRRHRPRQERRLRRRSRRSTTSSCGGRQAVSRAAGLSPRRRPEWLGEHAYAARRPRGRRRGPPRPPATPAAIFVVVFDDAHLTPGGFKRTQAAALTLFRPQLRDGDIGGVVVQRPHGQRPLDQRSRRADQGGQGREAEHECPLRPGGRAALARLSAVEAVRIFVNDDKEMMDMATRRGCDEQQKRMRGSGRGRSGARACCMEKPHSSRPTSGSKRPGRWRCSSRS